MRATLPFLFALFFFLSSEVKAQVVINEFSSSTSSDWIELYNTSSATESADLSSYRLRDSTLSNNKDLSGFLGAGDYLSVSFSNYLNNSGDTVKLMKLDGDVETLINQVSYGGADGICIPSDTQSIGRLPDGTGNFVRLSSQTDGSPNTSPEAPCSTPAQTLFPTPVPTPTPKPPAIYEINEVVDGDGQIVSRVEVYVDGVYVHHWVPETLKFCDNCYCDPDVACGFGSHTITLKKSGYKSWTETKDINPSDEHEVDPVMLAISPTIVPKTPIPISTPKDILNEEIGVEEDAEDNRNSVVLGVNVPSSSPTPSPKEKSNFPIFSIGFILGGVGFLGFTSWSLYRRRDELYNIKHTSNHDNP